MEEEDRTIQYLSQITFFLGCVFQYFVNLQLLQIALATIISLCIISVIKYLQKNNNDKGAFKKHNPTSLEK